MNRSAELPKYVGYIYKISHPMINGLYIGQTVKSLSQRLKEHIQEANGKRRPSKGTGALYEVIRAFGPDKFKIEELARVEKRTKLDLKKELNALETSYQEKYDSINNGLNRVKAPQTAPSDEGSFQIEIDGELHDYSSRAEMCRDVGISYTSLSYWTNNRHLSLREAVKKALEGTKREREKREKGVVCFRKKFPTYAALAEDRRLNRHKLSGRQIAARVRAGMSVEDAVSERKRSLSAISVTTPHGRSEPFKNMAAAHHALSKRYDLPAYSAVVQRIEKGEAPEEAFGFTERPWKKKFATLFELEVEKGYRWVGTLKSPEDIPVILHDTKEIFATKKCFAETYGLEYTETSKKLKRGISAEDILRESGHL